jgi:hypothetical protein
MSDILHITDLIAAMDNLAGAIREHTARAFPVVEQEPGYRCEACGSPNWAPGGMGEQFCVCSDCDTIGGLLDAPSDN